MSTWRTIDSAPTDGTWILIWVTECNPRFKYGPVLVAKADSTMKAICPQQKFWSIPGVSGLKASHWQPLPEPPSTNELAESFRELREDLAKLE